MADNQLRLNRNTTPGMFPSPRNSTAPSAACLPPCRSSSHWLSLRIVVGVIAFLERSKPVAQGGIDAVYASQPANMTNTMVAHPGHAAQCGRQGALHQVHQRQPENRPGRSVRRRRVAFRLRSLLLRLPGSSPTRDATVDGGDQDHARRRAKGNCAGGVSQSPSSSLTLAKTST